MEFEDFEVGDDASTRAFYHIPIIANSSTHALDFIYKLCIGLNRDKVVELYIKQLNVEGRLKQLVFWDLTKSIQVEPDLALHYMKMSNFLIFYQTKPNLNYFIGLKKMLERLIGGLVILFITHIERKDDLSQSQFSQKFVIHRSFENYLKLPQDFMEINFKVVENALERIIVEKAIKEFYQNRIAVDNLVGKQDRRSNVKNSPAVESSNCALI